MISRVLVMVLMNMVLMVIKLKKHYYIGRTRETWDLSEVLGIPRGEPTPQPDEVKQTY